MPTVVHIIPFPLLLLYWYGIVTSLNMLNYALWVRFQDDILSEGLRNTYLAFCIIGTLCFVFLGGPMFFLGYKYASTQKVRDKRVRIGLVAMYFTSTLPLCAMELAIVGKSGFVLQGICFVLQLVAWWAGSFAVWFIYMWQVAKVVLTNEWRGCRRIQCRQQSVDIADAFGLKPPLGYSARKTLPGRPDVI